MIIEQVDIINFKKYAQEKVHLGKRIMGIFGPNGSGKSTIFDAICWCLYGVTPTIGKEGQNVKQNELIRDGQEDMGVEVTFTYADQTYRVHRFLRKEGVTAAVRLENELVARSSKEVTSYITKTLGLDARAFISASFIRQNEIDLLTSQRPAKRKEMINRLFNLQLYDQFQSDAKEGRKECELDIVQKKEQIKGLRREVDRYSEDLSDETKIKSDKKRLEKELTELEERARDLDKDIVLIEKEMEVLRKHERKAGELSARREELEKTLERYKTSLKDSILAKERLPEIVGKVSSLQLKRDELEALQPVRDKYQAYTYKVKELNKELENNNKERKRTENDYAERISSAKDRLDGLVKRRKELLANIEKWEKEISSIPSLERELHNAKDEIVKIGDRISLEKEEMVRIGTVADNISKEKEALIDLKNQSRCPTCKQPINEELKNELIESNKKEMLRYTNLKARTKKRIERLQELRKDTEERRDRLSKELEEKRAKANDLSNKRGTVEGLNENIEDLELSLEKLENDRIACSESFRDRISKIIENIDEIGSEIDSLNFSEERYLALKKDIKALDEALLSKERLENLASKEGSIREEISNLEEELDNVGEKISEHRSYVSKIPEHRTRLKDVKKEWSSTKEEISRLNVELGKISQKMESNSKLRARRTELKDRLREAKGDLNQLNDRSRQYEILSDAFRNIPINIHERLKPVIQHEVSKLLNSITQGKYPAVMIDEEYTVQVSFNGIYYPIYRFSGGEKDLINLCLRIGISRVLVSLSKEQGFAHLESLFLDETFSSLDSDRRRNLLAVLNKLEDFFSQIVIITHVEDVKEMIPQAILIEEDEDGTAKVCGP